MNSFSPNKPQVSIIVPNYNHASYLKKRIDSILDQTFQDFELILLDDCSTDTSMNIIKNYKNCNKISHIFFNEHNSGSPFGLWKYGVEKAKGKYIWIAESDDWAENSFLEEAISTIEKNNAVLVHTNSFFFLNNEFKLNDWWDSFKNNNWQTGYVAEGKDILRQFGRFKCPVINVSSAVFRKDVLDNDFYPISYKYCGDWKFWIDIFMSGKVAFIAKPLNIIRIHNQSAASIKKDNYIKKLNENVKVINYANKTLNLETSYSEDYIWIINLWITLFESTGQYFKRENHLINLPFSFKLVFYKLYFRLIFKRGLKRIKTYI